jgi:hypothetical protein
MRKNNAVNTKNRKITNKIKRCEMHKKTAEFSNGYLCLKISVSTVHFLAVSRKNRPLNSDKKRRMLHIVKHP